MFMFGVTLTQCPTGLCWSSKHRGRTGGETPDRAEQEPRKVPEGSGALRPEARSSASRVWPCEKERETGGKFLGATWSRVHGWEG